MTAAADMHSTGGPLTAFVTLARMLRLTVLMSSLTSVMGTIMACDRPGMLSRNGNFSPRVVCTFRGLVETMMLAVQEARRARGDHRPWKQAERTDGRASAVARRRTVHRRRTADWPGRQTTAHRHQGQCGQSNPRSNSHCSVPANTMRRILRGLCPVSAGQRGRL